ncbi:MAG TPA: glycoside hydrolase family 15 protein, partial [Pararhizobium sp.]|nr:glycoside hydrolase family 15 protein [Pararhizobium sp.]
IRDYALIGDCRTAAVVAKNGAIEWLCLPNIDSPSVFASMLDREKGGHFTLHMVEGEFVSRRYVGDTNVLETTFAGPAGRLAVTDFMALADGGGDRLDPERELVRVVDCLDGNPEIELVCAPRPNYGRDRIRIESRRLNGWAVGNSGTHHFIQSDIPLAPDGNGSLSGRKRLSVGERRRAAFSIATRDPAVIPMIGTADDKLDETLAWWNDWVAQCTYEGEHQDLVRRSLLTLKLLDFVQSGAVVAAATTSLTETIGGSRNWDYRFCWLRDASFTLRAFADTGFEREGLAFFDWLMHSTRRTQPRFRTLYDVFGRSNAIERTLDHFSGYCHSAPVRIGNAAKDQLQLDVYGEVVNAALDSIRRGNKFSDAERRLLGRVGNVVCNKWREPDDGIWEVRGRRRHNTYSKVMCWSALDDLLVLADKGAVDIPRDKFTAERDAIHAEVMEKAFNRKINAFVGAYGEDWVDATALLMPRNGFIAADDPRMLSTWERIREKLDRDGWLDRYETGTDGMDGREGAFGICSFWAVDYLARAGRLDEAKARLDRLVASANDVGLYSEEIDPKTGAFLGNLPQAFTHTGFVNAVLTLRRVESGRPPDQKGGGGEGLERGAEDGNDDLPADEGGESEDGA